MADELRLTVVTLTFDAAAGVEDQLAAVLARYVVVSRGHDGCRNIDLCASVTRTARFVIVEKWSSPEHQRAHFDSDDMVAMAKGCDGLLAAPPEIDLLEAISAHDLN